MNLIIDLNGFGFKPKIADQITSENFELQEYWNGNMFK